MNIGILIGLICGYVRIEVEGYYIEKFINIWEDEIENTKDYLNELLESNLDISTKMNKKDEEVIKWVDTWEDFLSENEEYNNLPEIEQDKIREVNIFNLLFNKREEK